MSNKIAEYFNRINEQFEPISDTDGHVFENPLQVTKEEIIKRIETCKRSKSMVKCDVFPDLLLTHSEMFAVPLYLAR